jgi:hypothetical protein
MNKLSVGVLSGLFAAVVLVTPVFAWSFMVSGNGQCQPDGSFLITWTVDNHTEHEALYITASSDNTVVPVPSQVAGDSSKTYTQTADGTKPGSFNLSVTGHWNGDKNAHTYRNPHPIKLKKACDQPVVPPVVPPVTPPAGGMGGTTPVDSPAPVVAAVTPTPQVVAPVGAVSAGGGGAPKTLSLASIVGLIGSVSAMGFGIRGLKKQ